VILLLIVVFIEGDDEQAVMVLRPLVVSIQVLLQPSVAIGNAVVRRSIVHVILQIWDHDGHGRKSRKVCREILPPQIG